MEGFKHKVSAEIRVHLDEQKVTDLKSAAVLDDDYALTHKKSGFSHNKPFPVKRHWSGQNGGKPQAKISIDERGHLQSLPMINLTRVKLHKGFLTSRQD